MQATIGGGGNSGAAGDAAEWVRRVRAPHAGAVVALERSPFVKGLVLSVADWSFAVWLLDDPPPSSGAGAGAGAPASADAADAADTAPLLASPFAPARYTAARWSPSRPGVLILGDEAGRVHFFDLLERTHEPALTAGAAACAVSALAVSGAPPACAPALAALAGGGGLGAAAAAAAAAAAPVAATGAKALVLPPLGSSSGAGAGGGGGGPQLLAVGDAAGALHLLSLPRALRQPKPGEARLVAEWALRERARCDEGRARRPARAAAARHAAERAAREAEAARAAAAAAAAALGAEQQPAAADHSGKQHPAGAPLAQPAAVAAGAAAAASDLGPGWGPAALEKLEKEYREAEAEFLAAMGGGGGGTGGGGIAAALP